ncbi:MFS transporter [Sedimentibacter sp.]|uniref:MFS transporter n=1 Tax=Sedimentibacter sp. TaxID=1960295 RepID=UPI0028AC291C|nr:MFS transporter [Sedimentibacter sp.]
MEENRSYRKNIILLITGRITSKFGVAFYLIVLPLFILKSSGNLAWSGIFFTLSTIPAIIVTPFLGIVVDRFNRKNIIVLCDLIAAILYYILFVTYDLKDIYLGILLTVTIVINIISNIFEIASKVIFTEIVSVKTIEKYNGIKSFGDNAASLVAPVLGTLTFGFYGFKIILVIMIFMYLMSAVQEYFIQYSPRRLNFPSKFQWFKELTEGIHFVKDNKDILILFALVMALNFFVSGSEEIMNPGILIQKYHISEVLFGFTSTSAIIGTFIAGIFIFKNQKVKLQEYMYYFIAINSGLMIAIGGLSIMLYPMKVLYFCLFLSIQFLIGFFTTCVNVPLNSYLQIHTPLQYQGRFFALLTFSSNLLIPLGILYSGFLSSLIGPDVTYIVSNVFIIFFILIILKKRRKK